MYNIAGGDVDLGSDYRPRMLSAILTSKLADPWFGQRDWFYSLDGSGNFRVKIT